MGIDQRLIRRVKLRELNILLAAAQGGSLLKAGAHLAMSQPAVSKAISELEGVLGVRLLNRTNRGVEPTAEGRLVIARAISIFDELRRAAEELDFLANPAVGEIRAGCSPAEACGLFPHLLDKFNRLRPGITFSILEADSETLRRIVRDRDVELAFCRSAGGATEGELEFEPLLNDQLVIVAADRHPLVRRRTIKSHELLAHPWLLTPYRLLNDLTARGFEGLGVSMPEAAIRTASLGIMLAILTKGRCLGVLPHSVLDLSPAATNLRALRIGLPIPPSAVGWLTIKGRSLTPAARLFADFAREEVRAFESSRAAGTKA